jgi:CheY-like chemotaxis protein
MTMSNASTSSLPVSGPRRSLKILLADDQGPSRLATQYLLSRLSYSVDVVANGREALDALYRTQYDVVLMDVMMPEMDGLEATRHLRRERPNGQSPSVIAMTADSGAEDRAMCRDAGMDDFLAKPLTMSELVRVLRQCEARTSLNATVDPPVAFATPV